MRHPSLHPIAVLSPTPPLHRCKLCRLVTLPHQQSSPAMSLPFSLPAGTGLLPCYPGRPQQPLCPADAGVCEFSHHPARHGEAAGCGSQSRGCALCQHAGVWSTRCRCFWIAGGSVCWACGGSRSAGSFAASNRRRVCIAALTADWHLAAPQQACVVHTVPANTTQPAAQLMPCASPFLPHCCAGRGVWDLGEDPAKSAALKLIG